MIPLVVPDKGPKFPVMFTMEYCGIGGVKSPAVLVNAMAMNSGLQVERVGALELPVQQLKETVGAAPVVQFKQIPLPFEVVI